jgi:hypothetical protein
VETPRWFPQPSAAFFANIALRSHGEELTISNIRMRPAVVYLAVAAGLVVATAILRGQAISDWGMLNPDEANLIATARVARYSPVPWSTWETGTVGPYWTLFLAGLGVLGAPLTLAFAHLLSAIMVALTAVALFVAASWTIGRGPAFVVTVVWWFPIATTWLVGIPGDFSALSTEYLPMLLVVASALVPREQLAARPWLFVVLGVLAGIAVGAKYQVAPLAVALVAAQLIVLRPSARATVRSVLWWLAGAALPLAVIALVMVASPATNWILVEQNFSGVVSYQATRINTQPHALGAGRVGSTIAALIGRDNFGPGYYLLVTLAGLIGLSRHSEKRSNLARLVLVVGGLIAVLGGGMGYPHYLILLFGAVGLAAIMPVKPGTRLFPRRLSPRVLAGTLATVVAVVLVFVFGHVIERLSYVKPLSPHAAAAAFSADSVNRDPALAHACPPGSPVLVWGYASELYVAQGWRSTMPYANVGTLSAAPANRESSEPVVRAAIEQSDCIVDATFLKRAICPKELNEQLGFCLPAKLSLPQFYPQLMALIDRQFHTVPVTGGCDGCTLYVRNA